MIKPLGDRIVVKILEEKKEIAGILLATSQEPFHKAVVLAGKGDVKDGDTVLIKKDCGIQSNQGLIIGLVDVLAVVEK